MSDGVGEEEGEEGEDGEGEEVSVSHIDVLVSQYIEHLLDSRHPTDDGGCWSGLVTPLQDRHGAGPRLCSYGPARQVC